MQRIAPYLRTAAALLLFTVFAAAHAQETPTVVRYDNTYEASLSAAYAHFQAAPALPQGDSLGGLDLSGTRWFTPRLGAEASVRWYAGTSGVTVNQYNIQGPFIYQYMVLAGPEVYGPRNQYASTTFHALVGGAFGTFSSDIGNHTPQSLGLYGDQSTFASAIGGTIDVNRTGSSHIAYRLKPDLLITRYSGAASSSTQFNFGFSAGVLYRF